MKQKLKGKRKQSLGLKSFYDTNVYSISGIINYYTHEASGIRHLVVFAIQIILAIVFNANVYEWIILLMLMFLILSIELVNTAIESVCDLVSPEYHKLVKIAKDSGSGATYAIAVLTGIVNLIIFLPKIF